MATITIAIGLPTGTCLLAADTERKAAQYAEAFISKVPSQALPVPLSVCCADPAMKRRLAAYLSDLQFERVQMARFAGDSFRTPILR